MLPGVDRAPKNLIGTPLTARTYSIDNIVFFLRFVQFQKIVPEVSMAFSCGLCQENCKFSYVSCQNCKQRYHDKCQNLTKAQLNLFSGPLYKFLCLNCTYSNNHFDYEKALERLSVLTIRNQLLNGAKLEAILLRNEEKYCSLIPNLSFKHLKSDLISQDILSSLNLSIPGRRPIHVSGNGNCLFNSISIALCGSEKYATELRVRTCVELVTNKQKYVGSGMFELVSPDYDESCRDAATDGGYSSVWTMMAAASVIGQPIQSIYPPLNGILDQTVGILNTILKPTESKSFNPVLIMWTSTGIKRDTTWTANHFVPLVCELSKTYEHEMVLVSGDDDILSDSSCKENETSSVNMISGNQNTKITQNEIFFDPRRVLEMKNETVLVSEGDQKLPDPSCKHEGTNSVNTISGYQNPKTTPKEIFFNPGKALEISIEEVETSLTTKYSGNHILKNNLDRKFLDVEKVLEIVTCDSTIILDELPKRVKENEFFCLNMKPNNVRKSRGSKMIFNDNCGAWESTSVSVKTSYFVKSHSGILISCIKKKGLFCKDSRNICKPIEPQPREQDLVVMKRYYARLKRSKDYKKRVSWFEQFAGISSEILDRSVVEYLGNFPENDISVHGNSKHTTQEYIRQSPTSKQQLLVELKSRKTVKQIFSDNFNTEQAPRDSKQIHNMKYILNRKQQLDSSYRMNTVDDIQNIINMASTSHPFVREIIQSSGKPPNIICYSDNQLVHFQNACKNSIIGVDRTFNLGPCFVTCTVFQESNLKRKGTSTNPIILGPIYLHWDGMFQTYQRFFTHLASQLDTSVCATEVSTNDLIVGTDEEKALLKAVKSSFPNAKITLCTRHLEDNFKRHLRNKIGMNEEKSKEATEDLFGKNGLVTADTSVDFLTKAKDIEEKYENDIGSYLTQKVIPTLKQYVCDVRNSADVPLKWKNNNCESLNHILKLNQDWKPNKIPDLIEKIYKEVVFQETLVRGAIYGHGDFELNSTSNFLRTTKANWDSKSNEQKDEMYKKLITANNKKISKIISSSDGKLLMPKTNKTALKPGQKRRIRATRTCTLKKTRTDK